MIFNFFKTSENIKYKSIRGALDRTFLTPQVLLDSTGPEYIETDLIHMGICTQHKICVIKVAFQISGERNIE